MTSSGVRSELAIDSASPVVGGALGVIDANLDGRHQVLFSDGRGTALAVFRGCDLEFVRYRNGDRVVVGRAALTGVGCVDADRDGHRDLVRLKSEPQVGTTTTWTRTILNLHGAVVTEGRTDQGRFVSPRDNEKIDLLQRPSCGSDTFEHSLSEPTG
jgi:hypothetical protein